VSLFASAIVERREVIGASAGWKKYIDGILAQLRTSSGVSVTPEVAMRLGVFYDLVRILAEDVAKLPLFLYRRLTPRGKAVAKEHPLYDLIHRAPNPYMTSFELRETVTAHMVAWGNGYIFKEQTSQGRVAALWPLRPDRMKRLKKTVDGRDVPVFEYAFPTGLTERISAERIIHLRGLSFDGEMGYNLHSQARESIGLAVAAERHASSFFANDATPRTILKHPKTLKEDARKNLRESWEDRFRGVDRHHLIAILEEDMDVKTIGIDPEKALLIASREFSVEDMCRWVRMPPHKVGHLKRSTFSNIEHQALEYVVDTLLPWNIRWEQRLGADLLTEREKGEYFFEHKVEGLLRGDFKARMDGYRVGREIGLYTVNDLLELENRNPIGAEGDVRHVPWNWTVLSTSPPPAKGSGTATDDGRTAKLLRKLERRQNEDGDELSDVDRRLVDLRIRLRDRFRPLIREGAQAVVNREAADIGRAAKKLLARDAEDFRTWLAEFYRDHPAFIREKLLPMLLAYACALGDLGEDHMGEEIDEARLEEFVEDYLAGDKGRARWYADHALAQLFALLEKAFREGTDPLEAIDARLEEWKERRPDQWAELEAVRAGGAFFHLIYTEFFSIEHWRWHALGDSCPYCQRLHGRIVASATAFIFEGDPFGSDLEDGPLIPSFDVFHEPAHGGCDCFTLPVVGEVQS